MATTGLASIAAPPTHFVTTHQPQQPDSSELLVLLQRQDTIINELSAELRLVKDELAPIRTDLETTDGTLALLARVRTALEKRAHQEDVDVEVKELKAVPRTQQEEAVPAKIEVSSVQAGTVVTERADGRMRTDGGECGVAVLEKVGSAVRLAEGALEHARQLQGQLDAERARADEADRGLAEVRRDAEQRINEGRQVHAGLYRAEMEALKAQLCTLRDDLAAERLETKRLTSELSAREHSSAQANAALERLTAESKETIARLENQLAAQKIDGEASEESRRALTVKVEAMEHNLQQAAESVRLKQQQLDSATERHSRQTTETAAQFVAVSSENSRLREQLQKATHELFLCQKEVERCKIHGEEGIDRARNDVRLTQENARTQLEDIVREQKSVIDHLRTEYRTLASQSKATAKHHRAQIASLLAENEDLVRRLDRFVSNAALE